MEKYNYRAAVKEDLRNFIEEEGFDLTRDRFNLEEEIRDLVWNSDDVTGNLNGYDTEKACADYLYDNMDLLYEAFNYFYCFDGEKQHNINIYFDCLIRLYLVDVCISEVIDEIMQGE